MEKYEQLKNITLPIWPKPDKSFEPNQGWEFSSPELVKGKWITLISFQWN